MKKEIMEEVVYLLKEITGPHTVENAIITIAIKFNLSYTEANDIVNQVVKYQNK